MKAIETLFNPFCFVLEQEGAFFIIFEELTANNF
jgi:hypothetical protein